MAKKDVVQNALRIVEQAIGAPLKQDKPAAPAKHKAPRTNIKRKPRQ
jgi:hypothetical protein